MNQEDVVSFGINFDYLGTEYIFLSNLRRFRELDDAVKSKCTVTFNIPADSFYLQAKYKDLLSDAEAVRDNAGLMAIKFLMDKDVDAIYGCLHCE